ncbi:MAG: hypothetical protein Kow00114_27360 [Kiloniellaceae bacterium]
MSIVRFLQERIEGTGFERECTLAEFLHVNWDGFDDAERNRLVRDLMDSGTANVAIGGGHVELRLTRPVPEFADCIDLVSWLADRGEIPGTASTGAQLSEYRALIQAARDLRARETAEEGETA